MKNNNRLSFTVFLIIITIIYSLLPIVAVFFSHYLTTYSYMVICVLLFALIVFSRNIQSFNRYISLLLPFLFYQLLPLVYGLNDLFMFSYRLLLSLLPIVSGYYLMYEQTDYSRKRVFIVLLFSIVITSLTTIIGCIRNPYAARILATIGDSQDIQNIAFNWQNIGGYNFVYLVVLLYPLAIYAFKQKLISLLVFLLLMFFAFSLAFVSEYTTALLFLFMSSCLLFLPKKISFRGIAWFAIVGMTLIFLLQDTVSYFLKYLANSIDSKTISSRLLALAGGWEGMEAFEDRRLYLYQLSWDIFVNSPFVGLFGRYGMPGGHSTLLDTLAYYGLVGGVALFFMYRRIYRLFIKPFQNSFGYGYIVWSFIQTILLSLVNTGLFFDYLALYQPLIVYSLYQIEKEQQRISEDSIPISNPLSKGNLY